MTKLTKEQRKEEIRALIAEAVDWQAIYEHPIHDKPQRDFFEGMESAMLELLVLIDAAPQLPQPELTVFYKSMPESNGKENWTAILHRKGEGIQDGITIDRSEYPGRVLYAADRVRYLIGEKPDRPYILDYDGDKHSGYVKPGSYPDKLRDGWVAVPVEPTAEMISSGIAAHYERSQIQINDRPAPGPMECAYMTMVAAAPQQKVKK